MPKSQELIGAVRAILPFKKSMPVYMEKTILELPRIYINGGRRGYLVGIAPQEAVRILQPILVQVGQPQT